MNAWVYILICSDGSYYTGSSREPDLSIRIGQHQAGHGGHYTSCRLPGELVFSECFQRIEDAVAAERQIKGWSRKKKEALMAQRFTLLPELSKRGFKPNRHPHPEEPEGRLEGSG